jgi:hypothetical protein
LSATWMVGTESLSILRSHVSFRNDPDLPVPLPVKGCLGQAKALST